LFLEVRAENEQYKNRNDEPEATDKGTEVQQEIRQFMDSLWTMPFMDRNYELETTEEPTGAAVQPEIRQCTYMYATRS